METAIPGYTAPSGGYGRGKTVAYLIAPFAIVGATYLFSGNHQVELHPYAGFVWPGSVDFEDTTAHIRDEGTYGLKAAVFLNDNIQVEGGLGYMNHFESRYAPTTLDQSFGVQPRTIYALLYDVNGVWDFGRRPIFGTRISPYVTGGVGGLTTEVRHSKSSLIGGELYRMDPVTGDAVLNPTRTVIVNDNSAFFSFNYGGGIKSLNMWGPVGFRVDFRGRTFPNFRGESMTWPEGTAGLTFTFGER